jgi:hypothetical protein
MQLNWLAFWRWYLRWALTWLGTLLADYLHYWPEKRELVVSNGQNGNAPLLSHWTASPQPPATRP